MTREFTWNQGSYRPDDKSLQDEAYLAALKAKVKQDQIEAEQQAKADTVSYLLDNDLFNPDTADKKEKKEMQSLLGLKADGKWGKKSKNALANFELARNPEFADMWNQSREATADSLINNEAEVAEQRQQDDLLAKVKRFKELEAKRAERRNKITSDPNFQIAAMMALGGQPGALQALITQDATGGGNKSANQKEMDALEKSMMNDLFLISTADQNKTAQLIEGMIPYYKSMFSELEGKGAKSRIGGWDAWEGIIRGGKGRKAAAKAKKDALDAALEQAAQNRRGRR